MALRFYLPFTSLKLSTATNGEQYRAELWDSAFSGTATEVTGTPEGLRIEWESETDMPGPLMPSSATYSILIEEEADMTLITALAGAAEGRFKMVVRRAGSAEVYWAGWVHANDSSYPDAYFPFHFEIFATDGIARLKDVDYADDLGDFFTGTQTILQHLVRLVDKIGTTDVGTWPAARFRSTANWFANGMNTTTCPLHQAQVSHDRFELLDREGNAEPWNCFTVLDALLRPLQCQLLHEGGMYHIRQLGRYADATQKAYYYDAAGALLSSPTENLDRTVDYATAGAMVKVAGGRYTFNPPLKKVIVDYHHMTSNDRGQGQAWGTGDETWHTLPGAVTVDAADESYLRCSFKIRHKSNLVVIPPGSQPYPDHRLRFSIQVRMEDSTNPGNHYYLRRIAGAATPFFDIQPSEMEWFFNGADNFKIWAQPINDFDNNIEYEMVVGFTTPSLPVEVSGSKIQMKIDLLGAERPNGGDVIIDGISLQGSFSWYTQNVSVKVEEEGGGEAGINIERTEATATGENTEIRYIDTYIGDGPAPFSLSAIKVGGTATTAWRINNTGTGLPLAELLAKQVLRFRKVPQPIYQGTFLHPLIRPITRFVDADKAWMATRITLSAFENRWEGEFVLVDGDVDGISTSEPHVPDGPLPPHTPPGYPGPPQVPDIPLEDGFTIPPFDGLQGGTLPGFVQLAEQSITKLRLGLLASDFNTTHELPISTVGFAWAAKGDQVTLINPITGRRQVLTVAEAPGPFSNVLKIKTSETLAADYPFGSFVKLTPKTAGQLHGWGYLERGVSGTLWEIPTTVGILPTVANFDDAALRLRVKVWRSGNMLIYDPDPFDNSFKIQNTDPQAIHLYLPADGEDLYLEVR